MDFIYNIDGSEIDVFPVFIEIISINQMLYTKIDEIYEKDKFRFYSNAVASPYYEYCYFKNSSIEKEICAKRILGILVSAIEENDNDLMSEILKILSWRWRGVYRLVTCNTVITSKEILFTADTSSLAPDRSHYKSSLGSLISWFYARMYTLNPKMNEDYLQDITVAMFLARILKKEIVFFDKDTDVKDLGFNLKEFLIYHSSMTGMVLSKPPDYDQNTYDNKQKTASLRNRIMSENGDFESDELDDDDALWMFTKMAAIISVREGIDLLSPEEIGVLNRKDVDFLCSYYLTFYKNQNKLEASKFVLFGLLLTNVLRSYKKSKEYYFKNNAETNYFQIESYKNTIKSLMDDIEKLTVQLSAKASELASRDKTIKEFDKKSNTIQIALEQRISKLEKQLEENNLDKTELFFLREYMHTNTCQNSRYIEIPDVSSVCVDLEIFKNVKALVIGGSELWQTKFREVLPHFTFQFGDENFDENILINSDIIFMNVACKFRHNYFYKAMDIIRKYNKKLVYVSKTNINLALEEFRQGLMTDPG